MSDRSSPAGTPLRVGFVGLGVMGRPIARNILADGHTLTVYARSAAKAAPLVEAGATRADSPAEVAAASDVTVTMVSDSTAVTEVLTAPDGVLASASPGSVWVDMSSISPLVTRELADQAAGGGVRALDAPVSGGEKGAIDRTLTLMVGGDPETFEAMQPLFAAVGATATLVGGNGAGQVAKLCNQVIVAGTMCAVAEALVIARTCGVDPEKVRTAISGGAARSRILEDHALRMLRRTFTPGFRVSLLQKDLSIALDTARAQGAVALSASTAAQLMNGVAALRGDVDASAVIELYEMLSAG